jgi:F0F1-type ATP synthase assembly protein I
VQTKQGGDLANDNLPDRQAEQARIMGLAASLGFSIVATLIVCIGGGLALDQWLDKTPLFTLIGVALGLIAAGYQLYELVLVSDAKRENGPLGRTMAQRMEARRRNKIQ